MNAKISVFVICVKGSHIYYYIICMTVPLTWLKIQVVASI